MLPSGKHFRVFTNRIPIKFKDKVIYFEVIACQNKIKRLKILFLDYPKSFVWNKTFSSFNLPKIVAERVGPRRNAIWFRFVHLHRTNDFERLFILAKGEEEKKKITRREEEKITREVGRQKMSRSSVHTKTEYTVFYTATTRGAYVCFFLLSTIIQNWDYK